MTRHLNSSSPLLTKKEVAQYLKVSPNTIDSFRRKGLLKAYKIGQKILFKRDEVDASLLEL